MNKLTSKGLIIESMICTTIQIRLLFIIFSRLKKSLYCIYIKKGLGFGKRHKRNWAIDKEAF